MKILIAEDDPVSGMILSRILRKAGYQWVLATDGAEALEVIQREPFDALLTDWMMPRMDGIELTRKVRELVKPTPVVLFVTTVSSPGSREFAMTAGADDYLTKPYQPKEVLERLGNCLDRQNQPAPVRSVAPPRTAVVFSPRFRPPPFVGVFIASSTGGKEALAEVLPTMKMEKDAAVFIVQHGPVWLLESLAMRLQPKTTMPFVLAEDGMFAKAGTVYLAPGDHHLSIEAGSFKIRLKDGPPVNFVRPAADLLFRSGAEAFGAYGIGVVLTGMGRDGALGAVDIQDAGGTVLVQDPETATAASMPQAVINMKGATEVTSLGLLGRGITRHVRKVSVGLNAALAQVSTSM